MWVRKRKFNIFILFQFYFFAIEDDTRDYTKTINLNIVFLTFKEYIQLKEIIISIKYFTNH